MVTSGLRIGTPALANRGSGATEFTDIIAQALHLSCNTEIVDELRIRVDTLAKTWPLYPTLNGGL
ncbi:hypothetical protein [Saccharopolyspora gloriosae]|uniref:hypothetical protein n=1 Tax=Saccharopolyspora gloriosae TaxID=455344 RepID=UPI002867CC34|nr:hypothetical protein [Saccharopolyspora gloriosae]